MLVGSFRKDLSRMDRLDEVIGPRTNTTLREIAAGIVKHVDDNWTDTSPSAPGQRPAVVTEALRKSARIDSASRGVSGRFASGEESYQHFIRYTVPHAAIERGYGKVAPRPYLEPSIRLFESYFPIAFKDLFRVWR